MAKVNWTLMRGEHDRFGRALFFVWNRASAAGARALAAGGESFATD